MAGSDVVPRSGRRFHPAWLVAAVAFVALLGAAGFRSAPGVLMIPLEDEFGWSRGAMSVAVSINLLLYGLTAPFAAALIDRFGIKRITSTALVLIAAGSGLTIFVNASWQLTLTWGLLVGLGSGSMALVFASTVANRWFEHRRGLVMGALTAASATGQLIFLPVLAAVADGPGWRVASLIIAGAALAVVPLVVLFLHDKPSDLGLTPYGSPPPVEHGTDAARSIHRPGPLNPVSPARRTVGTLRMAARHKEFWALAGGFAICGATTNGLIGTHFIPAAHDHGMPETTAASLLAVVGIFDVVGTIASGVLTDRIEPRKLLLAYYALRGVGLLMLPALLASTVHPNMMAFIVVYGLDWVATVPPTAALCREIFGDDGTIVFGWVFASHQIGAAAASVAAGLIRDTTGGYTIAWFGAAGMCGIAALISAGIGRPGRVTVADSNPAPVAA